MKVFPNPYHCLDGKDRLAGACPRATTPGLPPSRQFIGARHDMTEGSHVPDDLQANILGRGDVFFRFDSEPVDLIADQTMMHYYLQRFACEELFTCEGDGIPVEKLAAARAQVIARYVADYGKEPDMSFWAEQFAAEPKVAEFIAEAAAKAEAEKKAKAEAEKAKAEADAKAEAEAKAAAAKAAKQPAIPPLVTAVSATEPKETKGS